MPPKRPPKRRQDEEGSSRPGKKPGKNKREVTYDTYEDAMDGGVEMEEKGERYRDGDKAQRFYEKALDLYKKAYDFDPTYDTAYNQARVLFTLSSSFLLPPTCLSYLTTSISLYRHAVTLTESTLLQLDAGYNLAQALIELAETIEDLHPERVEQITQVRNEAREILDGVLLGQEEYIASNAEELEVDQASEAVEESEEEAVVDRSKGDKGDGDNDMEVDAANNAETTTSYETHVPTPSALVDTALLLVDIHLTIWSTVEPPTPPTDAQQAAVRSVLDHATRITPPGRQAEIDLAEIKVLLAMDGIIWDVYKTEAKIGTGVEKSLEGAVAALTSLLASLEIHPPEEATLPAEILTILAETHLTTAYRLLFLSPQLPPGPSPLAQSAWFNLSQAVTHLNKALDLPTNASTPKTFKASVLLSLSKASLSRAKLGGLNETAKRNAQQLVENATTYANRAAEAIGWASLLGLSSSSSTLGSSLVIGGGSGSDGKAAPPWPSGWDAELLARAIMLQQFRINHVISSTEILPAEKAKYEEKGRTLLGKIKIISEPERRIGGGDIRKWVEEIEEDEQGLSADERAWWTALAEELGS